MLVRYKHKWTSWHKYNLVYTSICEFNFKINNEFKKGYDALQID